MQAPFSDSMIDCLDNLRDELIPVIENPDVVSSPINLIRELSVIYIFPTIFISLFAFNSIFSKITLESMILTKDIFELIVP
jgi:hypothetical protein